MHCMVDFGMPIVQFKVASSQKSYLNFRFIVVNPGNAGYLSVYSICAHSTSVITSDNPFCNTFVHSLGVL
jgi:hypothetical protein